jgi:hypothetical protein
MDLLLKMLETSEQQGEQVHMLAQKSSPRKTNLCQSKFTVWVWTYQLLANFRGIHTPCIRLEWGHKPNRMLFQTGHGISKELVLTASQLKAISQQNSKS